MWLAHIALLLGVLSTAGVEQVVCVHELKMGLMARSCLCPGFSTLMYTICCAYINIGKT